MVNMTREEVRKKFEQLEYLYLDTRRVGLFKIADNLIDTDSQSLCRSFTNHKSKLTKQERMNLQFSEAS